MGNRKFYDQMLLDACHYHQMKVTDEVDITTMKEYMQYVAGVDESPAYMGGKENVWRKLNLDGKLQSHRFHGTLTMGTGGITSPCCLVIGQYPHHVLFALQFLWQKMLWNPCIAISYSA